MLNLKQSFNAIFALTLIALTSFISASPLDITDKNAGRIHFYNDKNEEGCTLALPDIKQYFNFGDSNEYCENNMVSTFWLENIPSATQIHFYARESCSDAKTSQNFYIKFKTVKNSTDWGNQSYASSVDSMRNLRQGWLVPKKNIRIEDSFVGSNFNNKSLNEQLSCVYIERSLPVN